ncbi:uncharacterized protein LOC122246282 [Penaeus japonicus]|uniref:uncharacterized protein LOC122246282 n=1 Tax=Penaeus japonicus TaxID=27405 RepID=UPI001C7174A4|nr:uncharacterized protein LOC122246282 [Penaeus japonicus]XP_042860702.1 uncharacterized protein LOC122246282 [Penaeus japonicus]
MVSNTYLVIPVCLTLTIVSLSEGGNTSVLNALAGKEIAPSRPPEDPTLEDATEEVTGAVTTSIDAFNFPRGNRTAGKSFLDIMRNVTFGRNSKMRKAKHYELPIVERDGLRFFDVSGEADLSLEENDQNVTGITAEGPACRLANLELLAGYVLREELRDNCPGLRNLTLAGSNWHCVGPLRHFVEAMGDKIHYEAATCADIKCPEPTEFRNCSLEIGMNITKTYGLKAGECPPLCKCFLKLWGVFSYKVECVASNITDETIPDFPPATTSVDLSDNQLRSTKQLFARLVLLKDLHIVFLVKNQLDAVPYFEKGSFAKLDQMFLEKNQIKRIDDKAIKSIMEAKENNFRLAMSDNPLLCGKEIYEVNVLQLLYFKMISDWHKIQCDDDGKKYFVKFYIKQEHRGEEVSTARTDPWIAASSVLGVMNAFLVYLIYDLWQAKKETRRTMAGRRPVLDVIICGLSEGCRFLCSRSFWLTTLKSKGSTEAFYNSPDQVAIRRRTPKPAHALASEKSLA